MRLAASAPKLCLRSAVALLTSTCWALDLRYRSFGLGPKTALMIRTGLHHMCLFPGQTAFQAGDSDSRAAFIRSNRTSRASPFHCTENGWTSEWTVSGRTTELVSLAFVSDGPGSFRYSAALGYEIDATSLTMRLNVTTRADHPLPYGLGFHPWLIRTARTRLEAPAASV